MFKTIKNSLFKGNKTQKNKIYDTKTSFKTYCKNINIGEHLEKIKQTYKNFQVLNYKKNIKYYYVIDKKYKSPSLIDFFNKNEITQTKSKKETIVGKFKNLFVKKNMKIASLGLEKEDDYYKQKMNMDKDSIIIYGECNGEIVEMINFTENADVKDKNKTEDILIHNIYVNPLVNTLSIHYRELNDIQYCPFKDESEKGEAENLMRMIKNELIDQTTSRSYIFNLKNTMITRMIDTVVDYANTNKYNIYIDEANINTDYLENKKYYKFNRFVKESRAPFYIKRIITDKLNSSESLEPTERSSERRVRIRERDFEP